MPATWILAAILIASGVAKVLTPGSSRDAFMRFSLPAFLTRSWIMAAFPWLEITLGVALLIPPTRAIAAPAALVLMVLYLLLVATADRTGEGCQCFGAASSAPITGWTVVRNVLFLLLSLGAVFEVFWGLNAPSWRWAITLVALAAAVLVGREFAPAPRPVSDGELSDVGASEREVAGDEESPEDYVRLPVPRVPVATPDGYRALPDLLTGQALLVFRISSGCSACLEVADRIRAWGPAIGPVGVRVMVPTYRVGDEPIPPAGLDHELTLIDPGGVAIQALGLHANPSVVLLGTDALTAGGPVFGIDAVLDLVEQMRQELGSAS